MSTMELTKAGKEDIQRKIDYQQKQIDQLMKSLGRNCSLFEELKETNETLDRRVTSLETENAKEKKAHEKTKEKLHDLQESMQKQLEENEERMKQFLKDKHEEIEAITLKYGAELAIHARDLQEIVNQNRDLQRKVSDMKKWIQGAGIDGGAAVAITLVGFVCGVPALSLGCAVGATGMAIDAIRRLINAYNA